MERCELKSTGFILDEYFTTCMKVEAGIKGAEERAQTLQKVIAVRIQNVPFEVVENLRVVLKKLWDSEELLTSFPDIHDCTPEQVYLLAQASQISRKYNAERTRCMRAVDEAAGDPFPQLEKTYQ